MIVKQGLALGIQLDRFKLELKKLQAEPERTKAWRRRVMALQRAIEDTRTLILQQQPGREEND